MKAAAIVLAAGPSTRMGEPKQLLIIEGEPLLLRTVNTVQAVFGQHGVVVLGANEAAHGTLLKHMAMPIVYNAQWVKGMGASLKAGLSFLLNQRSYDAVVILVCDQPYLTQAHLQNLLSRYEHTQTNVVASRYADTLGVPALFSHHLFDELLALGDEEGAKKLLVKHASKMETMPFDNGEIDLDTPEQYRAYLLGRGQLRTNIS
jgi:molybdenum cofactor cytidylyltransferase